MYGGFIRDSDGEDRPPLNSLHVSVITGHSEAFW